MEYVNRKKLGTIKNILYKSDIKYFISLLSEMFLIVRNFFLFTYSIYIVLLQSQYATITLTNVLYELYVSTFNKVCNFS